MKIFDYIFYQVDGFSKTGFKVPARIHIRALIYLVPWLGLVYKLYKGISISWIIKGIFKYWMVSLMLVWVYVVVMNMLYVVFFNGDIDGMLVSAGYMSIYISIMYGVYFIKKAKTTPAYYGMMLLMGLLFIGGILMILWGAGILDWFHNDILGW